MDTNVEAAERFIQFLESSGRLEEVDSARYAGFLAMAAELDRDPGNASLWKAYWQVEALLREDAVDDDEFTALLEELGSTPVGDPAH